MINLNNKSLIKILVLIVMLSSIIGCTEPPIQADFEDLPIVDTPNYYTVCPPDFCNYEPSDISPVYPVEINKVIKSWKKVIDSQPRVTKLATDDDNYQYTYMQRSKLLRFPDIINVKFIPLENNHTTVAIYSQSKYGYSDMGVNKKRVELWLDLLMQKLQKKIEKQQTQ